MNEKFVSIYPESIKFEAKLGLDGFNFIRVWKSEFAEIQPKLLTYFI